MEFKGDLVSSKSFSDTLAILRDFSSIVQCLPGLEAYDENGEEYSCKIRLDVSQMHNSYLSTLSGRIKAKYESSQDNEIVVNASGRIAGSSLKILIKLIPSLQADSVKVSWSAEVDFGILIRLMGEKSISAVAEDNIESILDCVGKRLS